MYPGTYTETTNCGCVLNSSHVLKQHSDGRDSICIWRVFVKTLNNQSQTADKGSSSRFGVGWWLTILHDKKLACYEILHRALDLDSFKQYSSFIWLLKWTSDRIL
jgi:hypothetical protein